MVDGYRFTGSQLQLRGLNPHVSQSCPFHSQSPSPVESNLLAEDGVIRHDPDLLGDASEPHILCDVLE